MKKKFNVLLIGIVLISLFSTCDKIDQPIKEGSVVWNGRKMLVYDFTGHKCIYCVRAHEELDILKKTFGENVVIPVAFHCTMFANVSSDIYNYDFRTEIGKELADYYGFNSLPTGLVNSLAKEKLSNYSAWATQIQSLISAFPEFTINITPKFDTDSTISAHINIITNIKNARNLKLLVFLTEDNIKKPQKTETGDDENYVHNNVFRAGFNGTNGDIINSGNELSVNKEINNQFSISAKSKDWNIDNCNIVAFVYDANSDEVLQVEKIRIR